MNWAEMPRSDELPTELPDVRMRGFSQRTAVADALSWIDAQTHPLEALELPLSQAAGRVLAEDVVSLCNVPAYVRAMMDGFALHADDTVKASTDHPLILQVVGTSLPGQPWLGRLEPGQATRIMTGAPLPAGANAVLPVERVRFTDDVVWISERVTARKHVGELGEDIRCGDKVLSAARRLRPQDIGVLSSIGVQAVQVIRQPRVRIIVTGNELALSGQTLRPFQVADANGPMLAALVARDGGQVVCRDIVPDQPAAILAAMQDDVDVLLVSGGSSVGSEDFAPQLLAAHGELAIHGVALRPGGPTGMGCLGRRRVFLLPGNPVSCLVAYDFFAGRAVRRLGGRSPSWPYRPIRLPLRQPLMSPRGRVDYARVRIINQEVEPVTKSGSSLLSSATQADGFVIIDEALDGYSPGDDVTVYLYDES